VSTFVATSTCSDYTARWLQAVEASPKANHYWAAHPRPILRPNSRSRPNQGAFMHSWRSVSTAVFSQFA
jgi:hypothetical protein